jgi:hypothetical protein
MHDVYLHGNDNEKALAQWMVTVGLVDNVDTQKDV